MDKQNQASKDLLEFWEEQMKHSHRSSNYFFRKSPSHYHMMLLVMYAYKFNQNLSVEELKTKLFKNCEHRIPVEGSSLGLDFLKKNLL